MRTQLRLAVRRAAALAVTLGALPLLFRLAAGRPTPHLLGVPLPWLLLGVGCYPWLLVARLAATCATPSATSDASATCVERSVTSHETSSPSGWRSRRDRRRRSPIGAFGLRLSRAPPATSTSPPGGVGPVLNASAIGGEYLSAASFLGVAGLVLASGVDMLWYPVGWTAGYLLLLVFVAAPLRRSGAYTLPDFAEMRLESQAARKVASVLVVAIGWLYLVPQFQGAGLTLRAVTGAPAVGRRAWSSPSSCCSTSPPAACAASPSCRPSSTGSSSSPCSSRSSSCCGWSGTRRRARRAVTAARRRTWVEPLRGARTRSTSTYSLMLATFLGTMGLPHVVVRFYTNPDGRAARRTTLVVLALLGLFYLLPAGVRRARPGLRPGPGRHRAAPTRSSSRCPSRVFGGTGGDLLTALLAAGAFAAFLSTSSGLVVSIGGVLSQDLLSRRSTG